MQQSLFMPNGYSICPTEWLKDKRIKDELGFLMRISSLCCRTGYCTATNAHFMEFFDIDERTVSRRIQKLEKLGYISVSRIKNSWSSKRTIRVLQNVEPFDPDEINISATNEDEFSEESITAEDSVEKIKINKDNKKQELKEKACVILSHLNECLTSRVKTSAGRPPRGFRNVDANLSPIIDRLKEGYTVEDSISVINYKISEWANNDEFKKYLTPTTLFRKSKFPSYLSNAPSLRDYIIAQLELEADEKFVGVLKDFEDFKEKYVKENLETWLVKYSLKT